MTIENAKWELGILLDTRKALALAGRDLDYQERERIKELRTFLDAQGVESEAAEAAPLDNPVEVDGVKLPF